MNKKFISTILLMIITFTFSGCTISNNSLSYDTIKEGTEINSIYPYNVEDTFDGMELEVDLSLIKGKVKFELKYPNGQVQWAEVITSDKAFKETKTFDKIVGEWTLTFENIDNSGAGKMKVHFSRL